MKIFGLLFFFLFFCLTFARNIYSYAPTDAWINEFHFDNTCNLEPSFTSGGIVVPGGIDKGYSLGIQSDEKILLAGESNNGFSDFAIARYIQSVSEITVISPNGGEGWCGGTTDTIIWTQNFVGNVSILLLKGDQLLLIISSSTAGDGEYTWSFPGGPSPIPGYRIMISSVADNNIFDISDSTFTIGCNITLVSPNGGEEWCAGITETIIWTQNFVGNVEIQLFIAGVFHSSITTSTVGDGEFDWSVPQGASGSAYKIKILSVDDGNISDISDSSFSIISSEITVISPNGGEVRYAGTTETIIWTPNCVGNVKIDLFKGGFFHSTINSSTSSNGSTNWDIPFGFETGTNYKVKITSVNNPDFTGFSDNFTIIGNQITVTSPNGGEVWFIGSEHEITWDDNFNGNVQILLLKGDLLLLIIPSSTASDGSVPWTVHSVLPSSDYKIRIVSVEDGNIFDESDADFTITDVTGIGDLVSGIPESYKLLQNYPNPFNPSTTIYYGLPEEASVRITIYDVIGNEVMIYSEDKQEAGYHSVEFDATELPSGIYLYQLRAGVFTETKKMLLIK